MCERKDQYRAVLAPFPLEAMLFDLDGTLIDTAPDFVEVVQSQRRAHKLSELDENEIRNNVSNGATALTRLSFPLDPESTEFLDYRQELLDLYWDVQGQHSNLFEGMDEVLDFLDEKHIPWGIVTNKPRKYTEKLLDSLQLQERCKVTICPDDVKKSKPDPEAILLACSRLGLKAENCVYVGDHLRDIQAGKRAGTSTIAALYGYIQQDDDALSWGAGLAIQKPIELLKFINNRLKESFDA